MGRDSIFAALPIASGGKTKAIDVTSLDETDFLGEGGGADGVVFWAGPKSDDDEIGFV